MQGKSIPQKAQTKKRILIVDDHPLVRRGLTALIDNEPDLAVCAEAATLRAGLVAFASFKPDLVITDLSLMDDDGLDLVKDIRIRNEYLPVLVLSIHDTPLYIDRALQAGANGYVPKQEMSETLLIAIHQVLDGQTFMSATTRAKLVRT